MDEPRRARNRERVVPREKPQRIADELRRLIIQGELADGESLGHEPDLVARFGVSRPSLREALRILEAEGLISVKRGVLGGIVAHRPNHRMTARTAALVLQARDVPLADVYEARSTLERFAAQIVAGSDSHQEAATELRRLTAEQLEVIDDPERFGQANSRFHARLVELAGNQTLGIVAEMLNEIVARAVAAVSHPEDGGDPLESEETRLRGLRSQARLAALVEAGDASAAERHWAEHMAVVGRVLLAHRAKTVIDLMQHEY
ncbi:GntR family transcriptional regulator [Frankia sp. CcI49]|uniref:DNA-binding transcriptional regulator, FadR family n=1 Tax=Parafrankia irregularis TaxID=795642 RepID=A0A0S4QHQ2_9ACTN|nr:MULTISPECIES: GntR family transcriptional regulator [Frankiaceae]KPM54101.1 GntR family transcriptional regulator [Frankia sp. R43]MBE3200815.1 FadR family transcriptional regulator [Parafrankia sp. CH37]ONH61527.1 GntR family transcriptional regulator [Frankia sp. CcI49]CUU54793.1 DNA-binding transcriptional regulator, FadR family [Parafrankia irregularis]